MKHTILKILFAGIFCLLASTRIQAETITFKVEEYRFQQSFVYDTGVMSAVNSYGNENNDIRYHFQINCPTVFMAHHANSKLSHTSMYLLKKRIGASDDEYREIKASHGDVQIVSDSNLVDEMYSVFSDSMEFESLQNGQAAICMVLEMGEYELVCEGGVAGDISNNGEIQTSFYFYQAGTWRDYPIDLGMHSCNFIYESSGHYNIESTTKLYRYHKVEVEIPMILQVEVLSNRSISVWLYDEQQNRIEMFFQEGHYEMVLNKGVYNICLGAHDRNIWIDTQITLLSFPGNCISAPILLTQSEVTGSISFFQQMDMVQYTDNYQGESTNDVFFALQLVDSISTTINILPTGFTKGMFMVLQNSEQQDVKRYFIPDFKVVELKLPPGVHYLVCEGVEENGTFSISIEGKLLPREQKEEYTPSKNMNYIRTITPRASCNTSDTLYYLSKAMHHICYYDHLGRPAQEVAYKVLPDQQDRIVHHEYDGLGRSGKEWLPLARTGEADGTYTPVENVKILSQNQYADSTAFSLPVYDSSPFDRVIESYGPGEEWQNNRRGKKMSYFINTESDSCRYFTVKGAREVPLLHAYDYYPAGELEVTEIQDEDGYIKYVFVDRMGREILRREILDGDMLDTYYVYDDYGNLCFVLPPAIDRHLAEVSQETLNKYAYAYQYDYRNRCIRKKLPGCDWIEIIYDCTNRIVFTQDGEQRKRGEWSFIFSDLSDRNVLIGVYHGTPDRSICENEYIYASFTSDSIGSCYGYTLNLPDNISIKRLEVLRADYYDYYDYKEAGLGFDSSFDYVSDDIYGKCYDSKASKQHCKGLLTGRIIHVLGEVEKQALRTSFYYDYDHNLIQNRSYTLGGKQIVNKAKFNFSGEPISVCEEYDDSIKIEKNYSYDHTGRLKSETHIMNKVDTVRFRLGYDKLGRMQRFSRYHTVDSLVTDYRYNIRNWMTSIDTPIFSQMIHYTDGLGVPCYNGNISSMTWTVNSLTRGYCFTYDELSRMKDAIYGEGDNIAVNPNRFNEQVIGYDKMGNILGLKRSGQISPNDYGLIDNLVLTYDGNQLKRVTDNAVSSAYGSGFDFKDGVDKKVEYEYDANGNLIKDLNKKIVDIQYNILNLPSRIQFENGNNISYLYDANGVKLRTMHIIGNDTIVEKTVKLTP